MLIKIEKKIRLITTPTFKTFTKLNQIISDQIKSKGIELKDNIEKIELKEEKNNSIDHQWIDIGWQEFS